MKEHKIDFAKRPSKSDEWYTPIEAVTPILKYIDKGLKVWCPFDTEDSLFYKELKRRGYNVIISHIEDGKDFFEYEPDEWDIIVSNPPYSIRNKILEKIFSFNKPFALLMNTNGLFDSKIRWELFNKNDFTLFYLKGRVNYMQEYGKQGKSSPPFQSAYICSKLFKEKIVFQD